MPRTLMLRCAAAIVSAVLGFSASADLSEKNYNYGPLTINYRPNCDAPAQMYDLGSFSVNMKDVVNHPDGDFTDMRAVFTVNTGANAAPADIFHCMELHWLQVVTNLPNNDPATYKGVQVSPAPPAAKKLPIVDVPAGGWDYMYTDGAGRTNPNPAFSIFMDSDPFYYTRNAEINNNDSTGNPFSTPGSSYAIEDRPADRTADAASPFGVQFSTYLVAEVKDALCEEPDCLKPKELLLLGGFTWHVSTTDFAVEGLINVTQPAMASQVATALANGDINGWTIYDEQTHDRVICCPEPATAGVLLVFSLGLLRRRAA